MVEIHEFLSVQFESAAFLVNYWLCLIHPTGGAFAELVNDLKFTVENCLTVYFVDIVIQAFYAILGWYYELILQHDRVKSKVRFTQLAVRCRHLWGLLTGGIFHKVEQSRLGGPTLTVRPLALFCIRSFRLAAPEGATLNASARIDLEYRFVHFHF